MKLEADGNRSPDEWGQSFLLATWRSQGTQELRPTVHNCSDSEGCCCGFYLILPECKDVTEVGVRAPRAQAPQKTSQMSSPLPPHPRVNTGVCEEALWTASAWSVRVRLWLVLGTCPLDSQASPGEKRMRVPPQRLVKQLSLLPVPVLRNQGWEGAHGPGYLTVKE